MNKVVKSKGLMFGLILGIILALQKTYEYLVDISLSINGWWMIVSVFILVALGIFAISSAKKGLGGYITFKDAFSTYFLVIVVGLLILNLTSMLIYNVIDPGAQEEFTQIVIDKVTDRMDNLNDPQETIDAAIAKIQEHDGFSFMSSIKDYFSALAIFSVLGLLLAAIMKKKNPELE